jgi:serine/threonine protein kinase/WD40 repeat protein
MVRRVEPEPADSARDERLGEAIEAYLALAEGGHPPDPEEFAARYPDLRDDLAAALEGLSLVRGLVGDPSGPGHHRLESGHRIAGYRIVRELGRGGMGVVYDAVHVGLDRPVALKVLGSHAAPDSSGRRRFLNEARTAAGLHHTHIVPVFDVGQVGGLCYYAMQRIEGSGLDRVLRHLRRDRASAAGSTTALKPVPTQGLAGPGLDETASWASRAGMSPGLGPARRDRDEGPPPFEPPRGSAYYRWVAEVGRQAAEALAHAHHRGVIHRDVKPSNLLVDARGTIWMADFGLARRLADPGLTQHDSLLGTPRYMSPEQAKVGPIDGRSDVYSLGATLYELLTLRPPFEGRTAAELVEQIRLRDPAPPRQSDPRIPRDLETIVLKTLGKSPADRYATADELAEDLGRFLNHEPVRARRISPLGRLWRVARRHPGISIVSAAAAAAILTVATVAYVRVVHERDQKVEALAKREAALRDLYLNQASVVRLSNVPNRRARGLDLIKEAAALGPDPGLRAKLRDEAVEFLVLRDLEARPGFPTGRARGVAFDADGARLVVLSDDGERFSLWDVEGRKQLVEHRLRAADAGPGPPGPRGGRPRGWQSGSHIAVAGHLAAVVLPDGRGFRLFDTRTGDPVRDVRAPGGQIQTLLAAPAGRRFVTVESPPWPLAPPFGQPLLVPVEFQVNLWDPDRLEQRAKPLATLEKWEADFPVHPIAAIAPDGKTVATARGRDRVASAVSLWSADDGQSLGAPIETQAELTGLALGPHGQLAAAGGGVIRLWDVETKMPLPSLNPNLSRIWLMRFNPGGTLLAVVGMNAEVELWDTGSYNLVSVLPTPDRVSDVAFAPDGRALAAAIMPQAPRGRAAPAASPASTAVWAVIEPAARLQLSGFETQPISLAFRGDGLLALGTMGGSIRYWRPGRCLSASPAHADAPSGDEADPSRGRRGAMALAFDERGRLVEVEVESDGRFGAASEALRIWPRPALSSDATRLPLPDFFGPGRMGGFSAQLPRTADGRTMVLLRGSRAFIWHSASPDQLRPLELPTAPRRDPDRGPIRGPGRGPVRGPDRGPVRSSDRQRPRSWPFPGPDWRSVAISPAADRLYLLDSFGAVHVYAMEGDRVRQEEWVVTDAKTKEALGGAAASAFALSPDGATLAVYGWSSRLVALVDTVRGAVIARLHVPQGETEDHASSLAFAPGRRELAVGTQQGHLYLWSLDDPSAPKSRLPGRHGPVIVLAFDPTSHYLAAGGSEKVIDVWDVERIRTELVRLGLAW